MYNIKYYYLKIYIKKQDIKSKNDVLKSIFQDNNNKKTFFF